jgi:hypothetical protein
LLQENGGGGYQSSANSAGRGRGGNFRGGRGGGRGGRGGRGNNGGRGNRAPKQAHQGQGGSSNKLTCQICGKGSHEVVDCWHRYDESYQVQGNSRSAGSATTNYGVDTNWYMDSGATDHITSELEKLTVRDKYHGQD